MTCVMPFSAEAVFAAFDFMRELEDEKDQFPDLTCFSQHLPLENCNTDETDEGFWW